MTESDAGHEEWRTLIIGAADRFGTPCYLARWGPVADAVTSLEHAFGDGPIRIRSWYSLKTHPVLPIAREWLKTGRGVEVVSEFELVAARQLGAPVDQLLVNGVAKHAWLGRHPVRGLRVHFDSPHEVRDLLPTALSAGWRVGVRCHAPGERDARDARYGGQFGMTAAEAIDALHLLRGAGADLQGIHFHLGQRPPDCDGWTRAVAHAVSICERAAFSPRYIDLGGGLPPPGGAAAALDALARGIDTARVRFGPTLAEIWLENGRYVTDASTALVVRVLDVKDREDSRYLICDGGRTNHALAADKGLHPLLTFPRRSGDARLTTVCGPTCMTDDVLGRLPLPGDIQRGDLLAWMHAGAYHLPWETRFSHGLCAVAWCDAGGNLSLARERELPTVWADAWTPIAC